MAIYFISDTHFGDKGIIKHERTLFKNIEEHDQFIINSINKIVKPTDELWILGDIGNVHLVSYINGRKYLLMGNHDKRSVKEYLGYFAEVYNYPVYISSRILLSHHPMPVTDGTLNVHGHLHGSILDSVNHLNISAHMIDYKPVSINTLQQKAGRLDMDNHRFLEEWYANYYKFNTLRSDVVTNPEGRILLKESKRLRADLWGSKNSEEKDVSCDDVEI